MCRFVLYMGPEMTLDVLTTRPTNSMIHQSFQSRLSTMPLNGDGFGMAWYVPDVSPEPALFRSIQPAWNNVNLRHLARVSRSGVILAHVRAATKGSGVSEANCHPFVSGRLAFMHNGAIAGFRRHKRTLARRLSDESYSGIKGTTDSEHLFARFCDHFAATQDGDHTQRMASALETTILETVELTADSEQADAQTEHSFLNLAVTDGTAAVVSRYSTSAQSPSLYTSTGSRCVCEDGRCRMIPSDQGSSALIVASEPLTDESGWDSVPHNHLLLIPPDRSMEVRAIA